MPVGETAILSGLTVEFWKSEEGFIIFSVGVSENGGGSFSVGVGYIKLIISLPNVIYIHHENAHPLFPHSG